MTAEAKEHDERAEVYSKSPNPHAMKHPLSGLTAEHCKHFAGYARKAAEQAQELAKMHEDMAKQAAQLASSRFRLRPSYIFGCFPASRQRMRESKIFSTQPAHERAGQGVTPISWFSGCPLPDGRASRL